MATQSARLGPWLGGAILLGLVALMVVAAAVRGTVVAGRAAAAPVPAPPAQGDCLLEDPWGGDFAGFVLPSDETLPAWRTGQCTGARSGEVVSIGAGVDLETSFQDGSWEQCWKDAAGYVGLPEPATDDDHRVPDVSLLPALIGPDERQRAAGQDWTACLVQLAPSGPGAGLTVGHSLRDAWSRAEDRRLLAVCLNDERLLYPVDCREQHRAEQIGSWSGDPAGFGQPDLDACRTDVVDALGSPAALDRGDVSALALPTRWTDGIGQQLTGPDAVSADQPYLVMCLLVPADPRRTLTGPLRELGDAPVPFG